jgi:hypothetical protein
MAKSPSRAGKSTSAPSAPQPTVLYPVVMRPADHGELSEADIERLEAAGGIKFAPEIRRALKNTAAGWIAHDHLLQSPRPKEFRRRLRAMENALKRAIDRLDLNRTDAPILDRHLYHWLLNADFESAKDMLRTSISLTQQAHGLSDLLRLVQQDLPVDKGRSRPMDEDRFILYLADQFEASGARASAYASQHSESGYGETPFRRFVHEFYAMLPIKSRRTRVGLDDAILRALEYRRCHLKKG